MKIKLIFTILFFSIANIILSQNMVFVEGTVYDSITNRPIKNVNIKIAKTEKGTTTDSRGHFVIKINKYPANLQFSHISYKSKQILLKNKQTTNLSVALKLKSTKIDAITITANKKVVEITQNHYFDINDYVLRNDTIILITYDWLKQQNPWIVLLKNTGDTLLKKHIYYDGIFYKDCLDNLYIINENTARQLYIGNNKIIVGEKMSAAEFKKNMSPCIDELNGKLYLKQYSYDEQVLSYFSADTTTKNIKKFKIIADKNTLRRLYDKNRFYSMGPAPTDADLRFEKMCFFAPVYAPLTIINDTVCIFNFVDNNIEFYNKTLQKVKQTPIEFHKNKHWKKQIITDISTGDIYAVYKKSGLVSLKQINKNTGRIIRTVKIPKYRWISNIKINNNTVYFLYRETANLELTRLFMMKL